MDNQVAETDWSLHFLGVGSSSSEGLGTASAVLERHGSPLLLIDCGYGTPQRFNSAYRSWPDAIFITHVHLDHVSGLEQLYSRLAVDNRPPAKLFVPAETVSLLHQRTGNLTCALAEGRSNFWDAFQIIPVSGGFWHGDHWFDVFEARHHAPRFAFGLRLAGRFLYTGDTRPIPEVLRHLGNTGERLFHDCALKGNPSHSGWSDLEREYEAELRSRMVIYHYDSADAGTQLHQLGATVARPGDRYSLQPARHGVMDADPTRELRKAS